MSDKNQELQDMRAEFECREAGVAHVMEFYEKVEAVYIEASAQMARREIVTTSDSANLEKTNANLGRNPKRA